MPEDPEPPPGPGTAPELAALQRRLQSALLAAEPPPETAGLLLPSPRLDATRRLGVYRYGYRARLLESMRSLHPGLLSLLGPELFDGFAADYLAACPPRDYLLSRLGAGFADHLERNRPDGELPPAERESWIDLVIDLARLERLHTEVLDGPGSEQQPSEQGSSEQQPSEQGPSEQGPGGEQRSVPARGRLEPSLRLLAVRSPVHRYLAAVRRGATAEPPAPHPTWLAVSRRDYRVTVRELAADAYAALHALVAGAPLTAALGDLAPERRGALLREWAAAGYLGRRPHPHS
ncbi:putative DNA-binding domain-containing protein [Kitasatospora sp. LaBMicrA B282]|uniref:HvfC/BufC family peptide modification chaperone n=1 Tax=Kitasatospora sp. LaBMicrA B282 TaxID=3420949 RepID=UPI003D130A23